MFIRKCGRQKKLEYTRQYMKAHPNGRGGGDAALVIFLWALVAIDYQERSRRIVVCLGNKKLELNKIILRVAFLVLGFMAAFR